MKRSPAGAGRPGRPGRDRECRYYRLGAGSLTPLYRLCLTAGVLSHKDEVPIRLS